LFSVAIRAARVLRGIDVIRAASVPSTLFRGRFGAL
jgi:hypothetical protein